MERLNPSRETKFSGTYGERGIFIFPVQLTTSRIGNLTRLIHTLLPGMCDDHTSLSHTHYWYEVGMLKVPANIWSNTTDSFD